MAKRVYEDWKGSNVRNVANLIIILVILVQFLDLFYVGADLVNRMEVFWACDWISND